MKFSNLRSAGAEWGTKLKEPTIPHDPLCVAAWVPGITRGLILKKTGLLALRRNGWWFREDPVELEDEKHSMISLRYQSTDNNFSMHQIEY